MAGPPTDLLLVALVVLFASTVRRTLGFGDALVALPLLIALVGPTVAVPAVAGLGALSGLLVGCATRREIDWRAAQWLLAGALVGAPLGVWALTVAPVDLLRRLLGAVLVFVALHGLARRSVARWATPRNGPIFGVLSGVLGGMLGTSGPPVVVWATGTGWPPDRVRATLQGVFLPLSIWTVGAHGLAGLWSPEVWATVGVGVPAVVLGTGLGGLLAPRAPAALFQRALYGAIGLVGLLLVCLG